MPRTEQEAIERLRRVSNDLHVLAQNTAGHPSPAMQTLADAVDEVVAALSRPADREQQEDWVLDQREQRAWRDRPDDPEPSRLRMQLADALHEEVPWASAVACDRAAARALRGMVPEAERLTAETAEVLLLELGHDDIDALKSDWPTYDEYKAVRAAGVAKLRTIASSKEDGR